MKPFIASGIVWAASLLVGSAADLDVPPAVADAEQARVEAVARAVRSAVAVFSPDGGGGGSAVVISADGYALSNFHVTSPVGRFMKCGMANGEVYDAVIVGIDPVGDVALIKLLGRDDFVPAEMGDSDRVAVGDWCFAVGNPFLLATNLQPTVTYGIVSGVHRYQYPSGSLLEYADCIQTDASINPGNSGGPLFNSQGQLIGINGRGSFEFDKRGRVNVGLGYAISINQIRNFLGHLKSGRIVDHATLGATVGDDGTQRVVVTNILESSDAYRRGLRYGDEVIAFGGRAIDSVNSFKNVLGIFPRGWRVPLTFLQGDTRHDVYVRLSGVHAPEELLRQLRAQRRQGAPDQQPGTPPRQPNPEQEQREDDEQRPQEPAPAPAHPPATSSIPDHLAEHYESRSGYANFLFNRLNQERVWEAMQTHGNFASFDSDWRLEGTSEQWGDFQLEIGSRETSLQLGETSYRITDQTDLSEQLDPPGSGGFVAAVHLWRRLLVNGPDGFGDVYYLGTCPLPVVGLLTDTLVGTYDVTETHFQFDPGSGRLVAVEMFPRADVDPCEVYFEDYRDIEGRAVPFAMTIRVGNRVVAQLKLKQVQFSSDEVSET